MSVNTLRKHLRTAVVGGWLAIEESAKTGKGWKHHTYRAAVPSDLALSRKDFDLSELLISQYGEADPPGESTVDRDERDTSHVVTRDGSPFEGPSEPLEGFDAVSAMRDTPNADHLDGVSIIRDTPNAELSAGPGGDEPQFDPEANTNRSTIRTRTDFDAMVCQTEGDGVSNPETWCVKNGGVLPDGVSPMSDTEVSLRSTKRSFKREGAARSRSTFAGDGLNSIQERRSPSQLTLEQRIANARKLLEAGFDEGVIRKQYGLTLAEVQQGHAELASQPSPAKMATA